MGSQISLGDGFSHRFDLLERCHLAGYGEGQEKKPQKNSGNGHQEHSLAHEPEGVENDRFGDADSHLPPKFLELYHVGVPLGFLERVDELKNAGLLIFPEGVLVGLPEFRGFLGNVSSRSEDRM